MSLQQYKYGLVKKETVPEMSTIGFLASKQPWKLRLDSGKMSKYILEKNLYSENFATY